MAVATASWEPSLIWSPFFSTNQLSIDSGRPGGSFVTSLDQIYAQNKINCGFEENPWGEVLGLDDVNSIRDTCQTDAHTSAAPGLHTSAQAGSGSVTGGYRLKEGSGSSGPPGHHVIGSTDSGSEENPPPPQL